MITVIKNGKAKRVCCPHCESLLEYEVGDLMMGGSVGGILLLFALSRMR